VAQSGSASQTPKYLIGAVTKLTGLSIDVVRVWERRYSAVLPARTAGGTRLYSDADVLRLKRLRQAVEQGCGIGQAARLSEVELDEMLGSPRVSPDPSDPHEAVRSKFIEAIKTLDVATAERELARGATLFNVRDFVKKIIMPIHIRVVAPGAESDFGLVQERAALWLLRNTLSALLRLYSNSESADALVVATPSCERDEFGLQVAALLGAMRGWQVVSLGAGLPATEMANAARLTNARVLAINLETDYSRAAEELEALSKLAPAFTRVWIYGREALKHRRSIDEFGWVLVHDLDELDERLRR
jgi:DNA-binding transcriptional MerR regulator